MKNIAPTIIFFLIVFVAFNLVTSTITKNMADSIGFEYQWGLFGGSAVKHLDGMNFGFDCDREREIEAPEGFEFVSCSKNGVVLKNVSGGSITLGDVSIPMKIMD